MGYIGQGEPEKHRKEWCKPMTIKANQLTELSPEQIQKVTPELILKHLLLERYAQGFYSFNPVWSGFNEKLEKVYGYKKAQDYTDQLKADGLIEVRGQKTYNKKTQKFQSSVIIWLTEKGMEHFGIRPPTANAKTKPDIKGDKLMADVVKRFNIV